MRRLGSNITKLFSMEIGLTMKLAWLTDIHLNFLEIDGRIQFYQKILQTNSDAILISGDIAEATSVAEILKEMAHHVKKPIYFILGNHDYYKGQIEQVRNEMTSLTQQDNLLYWLPASGPQILEEGIILLGQDGWADGRFGDYQNSRVVMNDSRMIVDLFQQQILGKYQLLEKMQQLADADAKQLKVNLQQAIGQHPKKIIVLTHVPPFKEASLHEGKISDDDWLPFFSSKATGDVLIKSAKENPNIEFLILCGHTHHEAHYQPMKNITVDVGKVEYFQPVIRDIINVF